jgi:hypothetical protein
MKRAILTFKKTAIATAVGLCIAWTCPHADEQSGMSGEYQTLPNGQTVYYPADGNGGYWAWVPAEAAGTSGMVGMAGTSPIPEGATGKFMVAPDGQVFFIPVESGMSGTEGVSGMQGISGYFKIAPEGNVYFYPTDSQGDTPSTGGQEPTEGIEGAEAQDEGQTPPSE